MYFIIGDHVHGVAGWCIIRMVNVWLGSDIHHSSLSQSITSRGNNGVSLTYDDKQRQSARKIAVKANIRVVPLVGRRNAARPCVNSCQFLSVSYICTQTMRQWSRLCNRGNKFTFVNAKNAAYHLICFRLALTSVLIRPRTWYEVAEYRTGCR
jgi:hypothetical protein